MSRTILEHVTACGVLSEEDIALDDLKASALFKYINHFLPYKMRQTVSKRRHMSTIFSSLNHALTPSRDLNLDL